MASREWFGMQKSDFHYYYYSIRINIVYMYVIIEYKMRVLIFSTTFVQNISHSEKNSARFSRTFTYVFT
jgi:hypothetical protein